MTHTSCIENKRLEIRPSFAKFDTNVYDFYRFTYYMQVFSIQKTKRAFHQLKTVHRLQKAQFLCTVFASNFDSLWHSTPKQAKQCHKYLRYELKAIGVLLKVYQHAEKRQKLTTRQMTRLTYYYLQPGLTSAQQDQQHTQ